MSRPRIVFCYRYGLLGGVSAQLLNRYPYLSREYDVSILYESDYGMASRFPSGVARVTPTEANMVAALREIKPDITVVIDSPTFFDAWRSAGSPGRLVLEVHTTTANLTYLHRRDQLVGIAHIVTVSSYMEKLLGSYGLADLAPITVVPNCLDDRWRQPAAAERLDGAPVLWVGKLDGHKRWRRAVDIMDELALTVPDVRVLPIVVGGLTAKDTEVQALTTRLGSSPGLANAVWLPRVEYDRMPALYTSVGASGGVHLCTTSNESFGMAVAESLVCGCPVIAPAVGALPELLPSAALYRPGDWAEAREKARRALSDAAYREELLSTSDQVRELTTPERVLDAYREVVTAVLSSEPPVVRVPEPAPPAEPAAVSGSAEDGAATTSAATTSTATTSTATTSTATTSTDTASAATTSVVTASAVVIPTQAPAAEAAPASTAVRRAAPAVPAPAAVRRVTGGSARTFPARSPVVVASTTNRELGSQPAFLDVDLVPGEVYRLRAITEGASATGEKAALAFFQVAEGRPDGGRGLLMSPTLGPFVYFTTGPGRQLTDRVFSVVKPMRRVGLVTWENRGPVKVRTFSIEKVDDPQRPVDFFLSFDVEALPGRAPSDLVNRLVWGKLPDGEYGIRRICNVLAQHGLKANFMLDYASCTRDGEAAMREIVNFLAGRGHEIHLHLHSEWLARWWGLEGDQPVYLDNSSYAMSRRMLEYTMWRHVEFTGAQPRVFRAGGYRVNPEFVLAAGGLGLEALTNVRHDMLTADVGGDVIDAREPFVWDNGVIEIPVDLSPEPLSENFEKYLGRFDNVVRRKQTERTFNLVMHSWSLMRRNEDGVHDAFDPVHEERLHQICEHIVKHGRARGYAEYLDQRHLARPTVRLSRIAVATAEPKVYFDTIDAATCNVCDAVFDRAAMVSDICPGCGSRERHRQMRHVFDTYGNVFDGRSVLACYATPLETFAFLTGAIKVVNFDVRPVQGVDLQMDIQHMDAVEDQSFDCFYAAHVLNHVKDDAQAVAEIARVLRPGGVFVSTVPVRSDGSTVVLDEVTSTYGSEAFEQFGVGSYRRYGIADYRELLSPWFDVSVLPGIDPVTGIADYVFVAYRR